jgi:hypothetical protein
MLADRGVFPKLVKQRTRSRNRFELTHEFVSQMVGAPRPVV